MACCMQRCVGLNKQIFFFFLQLTLFYILIPDVGLQQKYVRIAILSQLPYFLLG